MQRPEPETPDTPSNAGGDLGHFTDWREQLRDRVREIRARKLADQRGEDAAATPEPDPAEQAAAARAEKLRAAREAIEGTRPDPDAGLESARIEQRIEEIAEEVAEEIAEEVAEATTDHAAEEAVEPLAGLEVELEVEAELEEELDEMPQIAARTEIDSEMKLGSRDRSARRSEIADVVDSLLGPLDDAPAADIDEAPLEIDLDALFGHVDETEAPEAPDAVEAVDEIDDEIDDDEWEAIAATDALDREPIPESADAESVEEEAAFEQARDDAPATGVSDEIAADAAEVDPFASAPAWARASFAPRKPRTGDLEAESVGNDGIPAELEDVEIPSWALPRATEPRRPEEAADLFAEDDDVADDQIDADRISAAEIAARALDSLDEEADLPEIEALEAAADELEEPPAEAPTDADLFAPEEEAEEVALFAAEVDATPLSDLLASVEDVADEEPVEPEPVDVTASDPVVEDELDNSMAAAIEAATASMSSEASEPAAIEPEPMATEPEPAEPPRARPPADSNRTEGDVFLLGEFRSRGRLTRYESRQTGEVDPVSEDFEAELEPVAATAMQAPEAIEEADFQDAVTTAPIDLFDEAEPESATDTADIEWDLDKPGDPDIILDAQRSDADPSAPVSDRIFSVVADAMVLLTIAVLLAIAGARAADVPIVPFVEAAPLPFVLAVLLFGFAYGVFFTGTCGQTLGKMAMRVRVIGSDSFRVGYPRAAQRVLYYTVAALPAGLGLLPALRDPEHRALHDRMSNTRVVKA